MKNKNIIVLIIAIATYLVSTGISYSVFSGESLIGPAAEVPTVEDTGKGNDYEAIDFDQSLPKNQECPLNGAKYSKQQKEWWEKHRPLGVMIENHPEARPHSGISFADIIYEAVAEGGITRFLAVFHCQDAGYIGPVRSARTYYVDYISEYGEYPLYAHSGGANTPGPANALGQITEYGWRGANDLDQFALGKPVYQRIEDRNGRDVATEHTVYGISSHLWDAAKKRGITEKDKDGNSWEEDFEKYKFKEDDPGANAQTVHVEHWDGYDDFFVDWTYNIATNSYARKNGGVAHNDRNTNKQIEVKNVVALFMQESRANDAYENNLHLLYKTKGNGKALIYMDGKEIKGTWKKANRTARTQLFASDGSEIEFNRGLIWFHILPLEGVVEVK